MPASTATCSTRCSWATASTRPSISAGPTVAGAPVFPNILPGVGAIPAGSVSLQFADPKGFRNPYSQQGTLAIEHQFTRDIAVTASYIWSRGIAIFTQRDLNLGAPTGPYTYTIQDAAGNNVSTYTTPVFTRPFPDARYGKILQVENGGQSWYNALALQLQKRFSHGLTGQINYTWSHAIDDADMQGASWNISSTFNNATFNGNYPLDKGIFHAGSAPPPVRQLAVEAHLHHQHFQLRQVLRERMGTLRHHHPGQRPPGECDHDRARAPRLTACSRASRWPTARSTDRAAGIAYRSCRWARIDIDQTYNVDARLTRSLPFGERVKANLSFEAFNAFNTIHNTAVQTPAYSVNAGGILKPVLTNGVSLVGDGTASQGFPDGTNARRMQVALRFIF